MTQTVRRKHEHVDISVKENVEIYEKNFFDEVDLIHKALPELDFEDVNTSTYFLGHKFSAPLIVVGMTGGYSLAEKINAEIAKAVEILGIGMGVGSQRAAIENSSMIRTYTIVRKYAPNAFVIANIGASQLKEYSIKDIRNICDMIQADALAVHFNALQECVQPEGEPNYSGVLEKLKVLCDELDIPIIAKETGCGISKEVAVELEAVGVKAIDIGGLGGTSFALIESIRAEKMGQYDVSLIGRTFAYWGLSTVISIIEVRSVTNLPLIASGGIRNGLMVAKSIALGADLAGMGLPVLKAVLEGGHKKAVNFLERTIKELKVAMFLTGSRRIIDLKRQPLILSDRIINWMKQRDIDYKKYTEKRMKA